jgi:hypothetical protein
MMKRVAVWLSVVAVFAAAGGAHGAEFSLYGGRFGMTRAELGQVWQELESGEFYVKESPLFSVRPEFDYQDRMYRLEFSMPLGDAHPFALAAAAYQRLVDKLWGKDPSLSVSVRTGRDAVTTTVVSRSLMEEYYGVIETQLSALLRP